MRKTEHQTSCLCIVACVTWGISAAVAMGNERYDRWQATHPFTLATFPHEAGGEKMHLEAFKESGLNTAMDMRWMGSQSWPIPESFGLPVIYHAYTRSGLEHFVPHLKEARSKHTNMIAVMLGDELQPGEFPHVRVCRDWVVNNPDPAISSMVVIDSQASGEVVSANPGLQQAWDKQVKATAPDVWMAQCYPVGGGDLVRSHYSSLEWYFNWAKRNDVAMWCWLDTFSSSQSGISSEVELRLQRFTNLAYGMRGFADFLWVADGSGPTVKGAGYWDGSGTPTRIYRDLAVINREVANIAQSLIRLTPVRAYHMDSRDDGDGVRHWSDSDADLPTWMRRSEKLVNVTGIANANHLLVGFFRDAAGEEYFMVVNKDFGKETTGEALGTDVILSFHPSVKSIQRIGRKDGKVETLAVENHALTIRLPGGTGDLFRFGDGPFAGVGNVVVPKLLSTKLSTACRLGGNVLELKFDGPAGQVVPIIRVAGASATTAPAGDVAEHFTRRVGEDGKTLRLIEKGAWLRNKTRYAVELRWADAKPAEFAVLRGDVTDDGELSDSDRDAIAAAVAKGTADGGRTDLNNDGAVDATDVELLKRIREPMRFEWKHDFDSLADGPLDGQGPWLKCDTLPGAVLSPSWISGPAYVSPDAGRRIGSKKSLINHGHVGAFVGSEARFLESGGVGVTGTLKVSLAARLSTASFHNHCVHLFSAEDAKEDQGTIGLEIDNGEVRLASSRGVKFSSDPRSAPLPPGNTSVREFDIVFEVDFGSSAMTWWFTDRQGGKTQGPFATTFTGKLDGINAVDVVIRGEQGAIDDLVIEGQ